MEITTSEETHPSQRKAILAVEIALTLLTLALLMVGFVRILPTLIRQPGSLDFGAYYVAARVLNAHGTLYDDAAMRAVAAIGGETFAFAPYIYPPFFAALLRPLAVLPFITASRIWFVFNLLCLWISIGLLARMIRLPRLGAVSMGLVALILPPIYDTLLLGQVNLLLLLLITLALYLIASPEPQRWPEILAGFLLGIAALIKIYPIIIGLAFLLRRRIAPLVSMIGGVAVMLALGLVIGGDVGNTVRYFSEILPGLSEGGPGISDVSVWPTIVRLFSFNRYRFAFQTTTNFVDITVEPVLNAPWLGYILAGLAAVVIVVITLRVLLVRLMRHQGDKSLLPEVSLLLTATLLILPVAHDHYLSLLLIPTSFVIQRYFQTKQISVKSMIRMALILICLLIALQRYWRVFLNIVPSALLVCFGFGGALLLWLMLVRLIAPHRQQPYNDVEGKEALHPHRAIG